MAISDQEGFPDRGVKQDSVIVDIERLSHVTDKDISPNSRIAEKGKYFKLQRSLSRKGSQKGEKKNSIAAISNDKTTDTEAINGDGSSKGSGGLITTTGKSITVPMMNPVAETLNKQTQMMMMAMNSDGRWGSNSFSRRHGGKRPLASFFGPRTVVVFFATLSSMGTILLIYFTLSMKKLGEEDLSVAQLQ